MTDTSREIALIAYVQQEVWRRFIYVPDSKTHPEAPDFWESHYAKLEADPKYTVRDDCDGLAATVVDGILAHGWPLHRAMLAMVGSGGGKKIDHLIGLVELIDGKIYVVGDTFSRQVYPIGRCKHRIIKYVRLDHRGKVMDWTMAKKPMQPPATAAKPRRTNRAGIDLIKHFEGLELAAYKDSAGVWTIGYGHTGGVRAGQTITTIEAEQILRDDLRVAEQAVCDLVSADITDNQFAALVSFTFNLGGGKLKGSTLLRKLNAGDCEGAAAEFARWNMAGGKRLAGLTKRRAAEAALFRSTMKPPQKSRTVKAGLVGGVSTAAAGVTDTIQQFQAPLSDLALYLDIAKYVLLALILASFGFMIWAKIDDYRKATSA